MGKFERVTNDIYMCSLPPSPPMTWCVWPSMRGKKHQFSLELTSDVVPRLGWLFHKRGPRLNHPIMFSSDQGLIYRAGSCADGKSSSSSYSGENYSDKPISCVFFLLILIKASVDGFKTNPIARVFIGCVSCKVNP